MVVDAAEVAGQQQTAVTVERLVGGSIGLLPGDRQIQHQCGFIDLHPVTALRRQPGQHLGIGCQQLWQQAQTLKGFPFHLAEPEVTHGAEKNGFDSMAQRLSFGDLLEELAPGHGELLLLAELRHQIVIVGIEPLLISLAAAL